MLLLWTNNLYVIVYNFEQFILVIARSGHTEPVTKCYLANINMDCFQKNFRVFYIIHFEVTPYEQPTVLNFLTFQNLWSPPKKTNFMPGNFIYWPVLYSRATCTFSKARVQFSGIWVTMRVTVGLQISYMVGYSYFQWCKPNMPHVCIDCMCDFCRYASDCPKTTEFGRKQYFTHRIF